MATKAQLEAAKESLLASGLQIPASRHRQFEQVLIDELYNAQSRFDLMNSLVSVTSIEPLDYIPVLKNGIAKKITFEDLLGDLTASPFVLLDGSGTTVTGTGDAVNLGGNVTDQVHFTADVNGFWDFSIGAQGADFFVAFEAFAYAILLESVADSGLTFIHKDGYLNTTDTIRFDLNNLGIAIEATGAYAAGFMGMTYAADYSASFTDLSIPHVGHVNDLIASAVPNLLDGSGTTVSLAGDSIDWGGTLLGDVEIYGSDTENVSYFDVASFNVYAGGFEFIADNGAARWESQNNRMYLRRIDTANSRSTSIEFNTRGGVTHPGIEFDIASSNTTPDVQTGILFTRSFLSGAPTAADLGLRLGFTHRNSAAISSTADICGLTYFVTDKTENSEDAHFFWTVLEAGLEVEAFKIKSNGLEYPIDLSALNIANPRWLTDKAYVDGLVTGVDLRAPVLISSSTYTFTSADNGKFFLFTLSSGCTATVPSGLPDGWRVDCGTDADGDVVTFAGSGATLSGEGLTLSNPLTACSLIHVGGNNIYIYGALLPSAASITRSKTFNLITPAVNDDFGFYTNRALTLTQLNDAVKGTSPSATWHLSWDTTADDATPTNALSSSRVTTSTAGASTTTFANTAIPAGSWVRLRVSAISGTITQLMVTMTFLEA